MLRSTLERCYCSLLSFPRRLGSNTRTLLHPPCMLKVSPTRSCNSPFVPSLAWLNTWLNSGSYRQPRSASRPTAPRAAPASGLPLPRACLRDAYFTCAMPSTPPSSRRTYQTDRQTDRETHERVKRPVPSVPRRRRPVLPARRVATPRLPEPRSPCAGLRPCATLHQPPSVLRSRRATRMACLLSPLTCG